MPTFIAIAIAVATMAVAVYVSLGIALPTTSKDFAEFGDLPRALACLIGAHLVLTWALGPVWAIAGFMLLLLLQTAPWEWGRSRTKFGPPPATDSDAEGALSASERQAFEDITGRL